MTELDDISGILGEWPFDASRIQARMTTGADGRPVIQLRVDLGVLQMERDGRPDGTRPGGFASTLRRCRALLEESAEGGELSQDDFPEIDRELLQYHHRRMALFSLGDYARAARDADHSLELLRLVQEHSEDEVYVAAHEKSLPFVLMERSRARVLLSLRKRRPRTAVFHVEEGVRMIQEHVRRAASEAGERTLNE
ncbi:MAG: UvrB/UvrC motif-containing protein, partial [Planctomycetota bacterium]